MKQQGVAVIFETAYNANLSKDIIAVPIELGVLLGSLPVYLIARPNPFQERLADHINLICVGNRALKNDEAFLYNREEELMHSAEWHKEACLKAAEYANILFHIPHFADPVATAHLFWKINKERERKATTYVKLDVTATTLKTQIDQNGLRLGFKSAAKQAVRHLRSAVFGRSICAFSAESDETLLLFKKLHPELSSRSLVVQNCPVFPTEISCQLPDILQRSRTFITVARLGSPPKATDILLKAWVIAARSCPGWRLRLVGSTEQGFQEEWDAILKLNSLHNTVDWVGAITDRGQLLKYYADSRVFVLPSRWESASTTLTEAMVAGCAVICTPTGEAPHLLKTFSQALVPFDDPVNLALTMKLFASSDKLLTDQVQMLAIEAEKRKWPIQLVPVAERIKSALAYRGMF